MIDHCQLARGAADGCEQHGRSDQLQVCDQAGGQMHCANLRAVTELQNGGDQVDDNGCIKLVDVMVGRVIDVADEEAEVERHGQYDKKSKDYFFKVHGGSLRQECGQFRGFCCTGHHPGGLFCGSANALTVFLQLGPACLHLRSRFLRRL